MTDPPDLITVDGDRLWQSLTSPRPARRAPSLPQAGPRAFLVQDTERRGAPAQSFGYPDEYPSETVAGPM
jgi:hypothetical protein